MTKINDDEYDYPVRVADDEKKRVIDLYELNLVPPDGVGIFDAPTRCYEINKQWASIVMGIVSANLTTIAAWRDATDESYSGIQAVLEFLVGDNCPDCTIEQLLEDPVFFAEYQSVVFGDLFDGTNEHNVDLNDDYDGTPQSIGASIPAGPPTDLQINALCYALNSFVRLYCSYKVCIIQSRNFIGIAIDELNAALIGAYNDLVNHALYNFLPDIFGCFVSNDEALTILPDVAAQEELACFLYEELKTLVMSQANFDAAILAATTALTGNAQKIACIMHEDNNLDVYLNFLEIYNLALISLNSGQSLECPCDTGTYTVFAHEFVNGMGQFHFELVGANTEVGTLTAGRLQGIDFGDFKGLMFWWTGLDPTWRIRAVKIYFERVGGFSNGGDDANLVQIFPNLNDGVGGFNIIQGGFQPNGVQVTCAAITTGLGYWTGNRRMRFDFRVSDTSASQIYVDKIEVQFVTGFNYQGYITDDDNICV